MLRVVERTKVCALCGVPKPWSEFYVRTRWEDGSVRNVLAYCKPCHWQKKQDHQAANPRWKAESCRKYRQRIAADRKRSPLVPAEPFAAWLRSLSGSSTVLSRMTGIEEAYVRKILKGTYSMLTLDLVDRALLHADVVVDGLPVTLESLYPLDEAA